MEDKGQLTMQVFCRILAWNVKLEPNQEEASENPKLDTFG